RPEVVSLLKQSGVNRLSVGVQSFDDRLLAEMGRLQPYGSSAFIKARLAETREVFDTLNADMMFNLPHQSPNSLENDLRILNEDLALDQLSFYPLMTTPGTRENIARDMGPVSQRHERRAYETILRALSPDYRPTSAWCFSRTSGAIDEYIIDCDGYC
ncbi:MAG: coproporphyrinogen III oxidase, partial [Gammaproteobacteria bacterium]|nr:coproporphyrinogen III oxidase [Gammaproteobacteria bacterium]